MSDLDRLAEMMREIGCDKRDCPIRPGPYGGGCNCLTRRHENLWVSLHAVVPELIAVAKAARECWIDADGVVYSGAVEALDAKLAEVLGE